MEPYKAVLMAKGTVFDFVARQQRYVINGLLSVPALQFSGRQEIKCH